MESEASITSTTSVLCAGVVETVSFVVTVNVTSYVLG